MSLEKSIEIYHGSLNFNWIVPQDKVIVKVQCGQHEVSTICKSGFRGTTVGARIIQSPVDILSPLPPKFQC